jgi:hypothetical protein
MSITSNTEALLRRMTEIANKHHAEMEGMSEEQAAAFVQRIIDGAAIVFGVFLDAEALTGVGMHIIKGDRVLQAIVASGEAADLTFTAVPCSSPEQAVAVERVWGDGRTKGH